MSSENNEELLNNGLEEEGEGASSAPSSFQEFAIDAELDGHRLDFALSRLMGISRGYAQKLIKEGNREADARAADKALGQGR